MSESLAKVNNIAHTRRAADSQLLKPISSFCFPVDPYCHRRPKHPKSLIIDLDRCLFPSQASIHISPFASHYFQLSRCGVTYDTSQSDFLVPSPFPNKVNAILLVKVVILLAVCVQFSGKDDVCELVSTR